MTDAPQARAASPTDTQADKHALRKAMFARRQTAHEQQAASAPTAIIDPVLRLIDDWAQERDHPLEIAGYWPMRTELDIRPLVRVLQHEGQACSLPLVPGPNVRLEFLRHQSEAALVDGAFGAKTPPLDAPRVDPVVLLVPLLAFNADGYRLGYGGGYYDRSLEYLRTRHPVFAIGIAYDAQQEENLPLEPTDQRLDALVTPGQVFRW